MCQKVIGPTSPFTSSSGDILVFYIKEKLSPSIENLIPITNIENQVLRSMRTLCSLNMKQLRPVGKEIDNFAEVD